MSLGNEGARCRSRVQKHPRCTERDSREAQDGTGKRETCVCADVGGALKMSLNAIHERARTRVHFDGAGIAAPAATVAERICILLVRFCRYTYAFVMYIFW